MLLELIDVSKLWNGQLKSCDVGAPHIDDLYLFSFSVDEPGAKD